MEFITKFNVLGLAIGFIIGSNLKDIAKDIIDDLLMPFVNPALNVITGGNGIVLKVPGTDIELNLEKVISSSVRFLCLSIIIFIMIQFGVKLKKPVQWVSVRNWKEAKKHKSSNSSKI